MQQYPKISRRPAGPVSFRVGKQEDRIGNMVWKKPFRKMKEPAIKQAIRRGIQKCFSSFSKSFVSPASGCPYAKIEDKKRHAEENPSSLPARCPHAARTPAGLNPLPAHFQYSPQLIRIESSRLFKQTGNLFLSFPAAALPFRPFFWFSYFMDTRVNETGWSAEPSNTPPDG